MNDNSITGRTDARTAAPGREAMRVRVPFSEGEKLPELQAPLNACDSHQHIYDRRVPSTPVEAAKPDALVPDYRLFQKRIGTTRAIVVNASNYAYNNDATLGAIAQMGNDARGIAVINTRFTRSDLETLHEKGIRGIRITKKPVTSWADIRILAGRIADLGWHVQFNIEIEDVLANLDTLKTLPVPVVFDHLARLGDINDPALAVIMRLVEGGNTWVKLSGAYIVEPYGAPHYSGAVAVGKAYVRAAPERVVWGSDWPHPSAKVRPDDAVLFDLNLQWAPTEALRQQILVRNPEVLYGFNPTG